jgi:AAA domain-containing protein
MNETAANSTLTEVLPRSAILAPVKKRRRFSHAELIARVSAEPEPQIIEGLLGIYAQAIAVGESTIGKTPLFLLMALCVVYGLAFLGMRVKRGRVMILDYENEDTPLADMLEALCNFLCVPNPIDENMLAIVASPASQKEALEEVADFKPDLVIVDSLRGFEPRAEKDSEAAALMFDRLRRFKNAWVIIHHPRKDRDDNFDKLPLSEAVRVVDWLQEASGHRALLNQSSTRIAVESSGPAGPGELLMRWNLKGYGDKGPLYISRELDEQGDPAGYRRLTGADLMKKEHQDLMRKVLGNREKTEPMHYRDVQAALPGTTAKQVTNFLDAASDVGVCDVNGKPRSKNRTYGFRG